MARCIECKKYVGCVCNLSDNKLCDTCEAKMQQAKIQEEQNKITLQINIPNANG